MGSESLQLLFLCFMFYVCKFVLVTMVVSLCLCSPLQLIAHKPMCVHKQKTRLARIRAVKSGGANAYLQYKRSRLIIDPEEEVTVDMQWWCCCLFSWFLIFSVSYPAVRSMLRAAFIVLSSVCVCASAVTCFWINVMIKLCSHFKTPAFYISFSLPAKQER